MKSKAADIAPVSKNKKHKKEDVVSFAKPTQVKLEDVVSNLDKTQEIKSSKKCLEDIIKRVIQEAMVPAISRLEKLEGCTEHLRTMLLQASREDSSEEGK